MRISIDWLKEYVDVKISAKELSDKLTMSGTENEIIHAEKGSFEGIVVGEILEIEKHPNADKLQVTKTFVGKETLQIVCGAPNIEVGQKVPVALVGAQIGEFEIREAELRGVKSHGMLCSEAELGISDDHTGIMVLDPRTKAGDKLISALNTGEVVLEAEITPNRGDCLSMVGIARETAVVIGQKIKLPKADIKETDTKTADTISVEIKDKDLCRRYMARVIQNVKIGASPKWMQERLSTSGVRPINNIVDVTNYVCLEMGQPLHAFDLEKISCEQNSKLRKIIVRRAKKGEEIQTLDGVMRELDTNDLVIADSEKAIALAGVMGGANSEVTDKTQTIVLESANFHQTQVRKTALKLALRSESSARFEKGLPLKLAEEALDRAASLILETAGGEALSGQADEGEKKDAERKIVLRFERIKSFLGGDIPADKAVAVLESLGFKTAAKDKEKAEFVVPHWRLDVLGEEDLLEEVSRIYGYENIPSTLPEGVLPIHERNENIRISKKIREVLTALGFFEIYSYSFTAKDKANMIRKGEDLVKIANPLSQEQEYMRADLLGSLLLVISKNRDYRAGDTQKLYEIASIYSQKEEALKLSGLVSGGDTEDVFREAKGAIDTLLGRLGIEKTDFREGASGSAEIFTGQKELGRFVTLDSEDIKRFKIKSKSICFFEMDIKALSDAVQIKKFQNIPKFPSSERDLAFVVDEGITADTIYKTVKEIKSGIRSKVEAVDVYRGRGIPGGKKSISFKFIYQSEERTLTDKEVDDDQTAVKKKVKDILGGILRGEGS